MGNLLLLLAPFAPLVIVPLGLWLAGAPAWTLRLIWAASLPLAASFAFEQGAAAGALAVPYLAFTAAVGVAVGLGRLLRRGFHPLDEFAIDAAMLNLGMGGFWMVLSRLGIRVMSFSEAIILLTAIHFHYAGFAACVLTAMTGRALGERAESAAYKWTAWAVLLGTPLLAIGITVSRWVEVAAAFWLAFGIIALSGLAMVAAQFLGKRLLMMGLSVAAASAVISMAMAAVYAASEFSGAYWLPIPQMAIIHGVANAIGFSLVGLLAWATVRPQPRYMAQAQAPIPFSRLAGDRTGWIGPDFFERTGATTGASHTAGGLTDNLDEYARKDCDTAGVAAPIRAFYQETGRHALRVRANWSPWFVPAARLFRWWSRRTGQLTLPLGLEPGGEQIETRIFALAEAMDGREKPRAWVRTYAQSGEVVYLAAYSSHKDAGGCRYMNIAFPLPGGNLTSILHLSRYRDGLALSTRWNAKPGGQQGVYLSGGKFPVRLPLDETIWIWTGDAGQVVARHDMWLLGIRYLRLDYQITASKPA